MLYVTNLFPHWFLIVLRLHREQKEKRKKEEAHTEQKRQELLGKAKRTLKAIEQWCSCRTRHLWLNTPNPSGIWGMSLHSGNAHNSPRMAFSARERTDRYVISNCWVLQRWLFLYNLTHWMVLPLTVDCILTAKELQWNIWSRIFKHNS